MASLAGTRSASSEFFLLVLIQEKGDKKGGEREKQHDRPRGAERKKKNREDKRKIQQMEGEEKHARQREVKQKRANNVRQ